MSMGFGFSLPAYPLRGGGGNNPFNQSGPTLDLSFTGNAGNLSGADTYTLDTNFITPQYQVAAQYAVWVDGSGMTQRNFADIVTFTRASTATYFNSAGTLTTAAINEARFDYNPSTLAAQGLLIEEQRTNSIRNNTMQGAVAGTPGTAPTNWSGELGAGYGLTMSIPTVATVNGIQSITYRANGTTTTGGAAVLLFEGVTNAAAAPSQVWTGSCYLALTAGSFTNVDALSLALREYDSGGNFLRQTLQDIKTITATTTRITVSATLGASTAFVALGLRVFYGTPPLAVDYTLRIGLPQLEQGAFATSVIPTTTTALTRSADVASVNTLSPWFNATEGTLFAEWTRGYTGNFTTYVAGAIITNNLSGASANNISAGTTNGVNQQIFNSMVVNNVEQLTYQFENTATTNKTALAYKTNDTQQFTNGVAETADTSCTVPTSLSQMNIGAGGVHNAFINSWIRRITYYPRRLSQADGITITA